MSSFYCLFQNLGWLDTWGRGCHKDLISFLSRKTPSSDLCHTMLHWTECQWKQWTCTKPSVGKSTQTQTQCMSSLGCGKEDTRAAWCMSTNVIAWDAESTCHLHQWKWTLTPIGYFCWSYMAQVRQWYQWKDNARWCTLLCTLLTSVVRLETILVMAVWLGFRWHFRCPHSWKSCCGSLCAPMRLDWLRQGHSGIWSSILGLSLT